MGDPFMVSRSQSTILLTDPKSSVSKTKGTGLKDRRPDSSCTVVSVLLDPEHVRDHL